MQARENLQFVREKFDVKSSTRRVVVGKAEIDEVVSKWTGVPLTSINQDEGDKLLHMEDALHKRVISQEKAISALSRAIRRSRAGLKNPNRPVGSFVFLGPTGVGKTELARALANFLFGSDHALIRFDMSEYMEKHSVSKLIGSPPGYVGHEEGGQLTEKVKRNPYSVVLLDEIEKAHPDLFNILLQVFEDGHLTDGLGNRVNFKNTIIIMTSNIGARFIQKKASLGFQSADSGAISRSVNDMVLGEVRKTFNPEFINRIDEIIVFEALSDDDLRTITQLLVKQLNDNLVDRKIRLELAPEVVDWIIEQTCKDRSYGARPLRRAIQRYIEDPLSEELIRGHLKGGDIEVYLDGGTLAYRPAGEAAGRPPAGLTRLQCSGRHGYGESARPRRGLARLRSSKLMAVARPGTRPLPGSSTAWLVQRPTYACCFCFSFAALTAAAAARAQTPRRPARRAAPRPLRRGAGAATGQTVCGQPVPAPAQLPPAGSGPVRLLRSCPASRSRAAVPVVEANTYLYYIEMKSRVSNSQTGTVGAVRRRDRADHPRRLQAAVGDELPRRPRDRGPGLPLRQRRHRQDHRLQHGGAAAGQDRRLRRPEEGRPVEDRRKAEREEHHDPARLVHRSRAHPPGHRRRPRALRGEGLSVRRGQARDQGRRGRHRSSCTSPSTSPKGPKVKIRDIDFVGNKAISDGKLARKMKENKEQGFFGFITGGGTYKEDKFAEDADSSSPTTTATRATSWRRWASRR